MVYKTCSKSFIYHPINMEWDKHSTHILYSEYSYNKFLSDVFGLRFNFELFHRTKADETYHNHEFDIIDEKKWLLAKLKYGF
jgi:hypothetical protein